MKTTKKKVKSDVHNFVSDKRLKKIKKLIDKSISKTETIGKIITLMSDEFYDDGIGTNRLLFRHDSKYKDLVFKVATDKHGIEANYREFYNGDLDDRLVYSYSISDDGTFLVQESIPTVLTSKLRDKHKKDLLKLLKHLSKKLLLVDLSLRTFRNFGIRSNGELVVLDHGDTVPLRDYQGGVEKSVNADEEFFVSLKCKVMDFKKGRKHPKPCGGHLHYSKDYSTLICDKCGNECLVNEAYKQFYPDKLREEKEGMTNEGMYLPDFDPVEFERQCIENARIYAQEKMKETAKEEEKMYGRGDTVNIGGQEYGEHKGLLYPIDSTSDYNDFVSVRKNKLKPKLFFKQRGLDMSEYSKLKVMNNAPTTYESTEEEIMENISSNKEFVLKLENIINSMLDTVYDASASDLTKSLYGGDILRIPLGNDVKALADEYDIKKNDICKFITKNAKNKTDKVFNVWCHSGDLCVELHRNYVSELRKREKGSKPMNNDIRVIFDDDDLSAENRTVINRKECIEYRGYYVPIEIIEENDMVLQIPRGDVRAFLDNEGYDGSRYNVKSNSHSSDDDDEDEDAVDVILDEDDDESSTYYLIDELVTYRAPGCDFKLDISDHGVLSMNVSLNSLRYVKYVNTVKIPVFGEVLTDESIMDIKRIYCDVDDIIAKYEDNECYYTIEFCNRFDVRKKLSNFHIYDANPVAIYTAYESDDPSELDICNTPKYNKGVACAWYNLVYNETSPLWNKFNSAKIHINNGFNENTKDINAANKYMTDGKFIDCIIESLDECMYDNILLIDDVMNENVHEWLFSQCDNSDANVFIGYCTAYWDSYEDDEEEYSDTEIDSDLMDAYNDDIDDIVDDTSNEHHECKCGGHCHNKQGTVDLDDMTLTDEQKAQLSEVINNAITSALKIFMTVGAEKIQQVSEYIEQENAIKRGEDVKGAIPVQYETIKNKNIAVEKDGKFYHIDIEKIVHSLITEDADSKTSKVLSKFASIE